MNFDRLEKLASFLETQVEPARFNYSKWFARPGGGDIQGEQKEHPLHECGSLGCAFGWATMIPEFQELGLATNIHGSIRYKNSGGFLAAAKFFECSEGEAFFLFSPHCELSRLGWASPGAKATPQEVADHIRKVMAAAREAE